MLIPKFDLYKAEWLDLVFENRNKTYGAYDLRSHYAENMTRAMAVTVCGCVLTALTVAYVTRFKPAPVTPIEHTTVINLSNRKVVLPPPPKAEKPVAPAQHAKAAAPVKTVVIPTHLTTEPVLTEPPTKAEIAQSAIGSEVIKAPGSAVNAPVDNLPGTGTGNQGTADKGNDKTIYDFAEVSPEPNGGMAGWSKFLQRNLRYPDTEAQGRVFVSFIVEPDGSLSNIKIERGVSPELDREALRVLKMAPKWKPGMQNHQPVRVQFNIPINFQLNN